MTQPTRPLGHSSRPAREAPQYTLRPWRWFRSPRTCRQPGEGGGSRAQGGVLKRVKKTQHKARSETRASATHRIQEVEGAQAVLGAGEAAAHHRAPLAPAASPARPASPPSRFGSPRLRLKRAGERGAAAAAIPSALFLRQCSQRAQRNLIRPRPDSAAPAYWLL